MEEPKKKYHLFEVTGVELEYMLVKRETLEVSSISDLLLQTVTGNFNSDFENGEIAWSNELVLHVIELKTNGPRTSLNYLFEIFQDNVLKINSILKNHQVQLLPSGVHPFMDPFSEAKIWPHEYNEVYASYDKIFDCRGHGWSNLQSTHINLPFFDDDEFAKLHAAIRILLPIIPALSASSPILDGKFTGFLDTRLEVYRQNQKKVPSVAGKIIPEKLFSKEEYEKFILQKIYSDIAMYDSKKILQNEWINSRGAIPRFERNTIEIRIMDNQECPQADISVVAFIITTLKAIIKEQWIPLEKQMEWEEDRLLEIFLKTVKDGENAVLKDEDYLRCFGLKEKQTTAGEIWKHLFLILGREKELAGFNGTLEFILREGTLASRILKKMNGNESRENIIKVYENLSKCLGEGKLFI